MVSLSETTLRDMLKAAYVNGFEDRHLLQGGIAATHRHLEKDGPTKYATEDFEASVTFDTFEANMKNFRNGKALG